MSDFLNNLIARSYGLMPVAQPRLTSCFEPVANNAWADHTWADHSQAFPLESEELRPQSDETKTDVTYLQATHAQTIHEPEAEQALKRSPGVEPELSDSSPEGARIVARSIKTEWRQPDVGLMADAANYSQPGEKASRAETARPSTQNLAQADRRAEVPPAQADRRVEVPSSVNQAQRLESEAAVEPNTTRPAADRVLNEHHTMAAERGLNDHHTIGDRPSPSNLSVNHQRNVDLKRRAVAPTKVALQSEERVEQQQQVAPVSIKTPSGAVAESSPPNIRVTIGRIDVRAVVPDSKPTQNPAPPCQTHVPLSLEEYLERRNGGER